MAYPPIPFVRPDTTPVTLQNVAAWHGPLTRIKSLHAALFQTLGPLVQSHPEWKINAPVDEADAFTRLYDHLPNAELVVEKFLRNPTVGALNQLCDRFAVRLDDIFTGLDRALQAHGNTSIDAAQRSEVAQMRATAGELHHALQGLYAQAADARAEAKATSHAVHAQQSRGEGWARG